MSETYKGCHCKYPEEMLVNPPPMAGVPDMVTCWTRQVTFGSGVRFRHRDKYNGPIYSFHHAPIPGCMAHQPLCLLKGEQGTNIITHQTFWGRNFGSYVPVCPS